MISGVEIVTPAECNNFRQVKMTPGQSTPVTVGWYLSRSAVRSGALQDRVQVLQSAAYVGYDLI